MVIRFNWFAYSVVVGFLQRGERKAETDRQKPGSGQQGQGNSERRWPGDHLFDLTKTVRDELRHHIWAAGIRRSNKQELLLSLPRVLHSYSALTVLQAHPFRVAINNFIERETATRCSIHLNDEELLALWREVR